MSTESRPPWRVVWLARAGGWLVRALAATWRFQASHTDELRRLRASRTPVIFSLWHGQLLPLLYYHRNEGVAVLISEHADGEIIARIAISLGYRTVRGSTSRGAARALLGLVRVIGEGSDLAITPDGPRGPAKSVAPGVSVVAQRSGAAVFCTSAHATSAWHLNSWDRFMIPRPFARIRVAYSDAVYIAAETPRDAVEHSDALSTAMAVAEARSGGSDV